MKILKTLYHGPEAFAQLLRDSGFAADNKSECLVRIYPSACVGEDAVKIAREIKIFLPKAYIIGCSGCGVILDAKQYNTETLVIAEFFSKSTIAVNTYNFSNKTGKETACEVASDLVSRCESENMDITECGVKLMHVLCSGHYAEVSQFLDSFNEFNCDIAMVGGIAGDILPLNICGYVFTENGVVENGIVTASIFGDIYKYTSLNTSHEPISPVYTVGRCDGSFILDIDGIPATEWCQEQLGLDYLKSYEDWQIIAENDDLIRFPIMLEGHTGASLFLKYDSENKKISLYFLNLLEGTKFRIGYSSPSKCVQESMNTCEEIKNYPIESFFSYSCLFRKLYLQNCSELELRPFEKNGICGVFMMGEIGYSHGKNEFSNGSCVMVGIAEDKHYITPAFNVYENLTLIKDENENLLNFVIRKQSKEMSCENRRLMEKLLKQQEYFAQQLYIDPNTDLKTASSFLQEHQVYEFDKLCLIQIENFDLLFSQFGQAECNRLIRVMISWFREFLIGTKNGEMVYLYTFNDRTIFITANAFLEDNEFMNLVQSVFEHFQFICLGGENEILINRFVTVLHQENLLEKGLSTLEGSRNLQTHFLICDHEDVSSIQMRDELDMLRILDQAIKYKRVIPYFQGIYNNITGKITKYEALMRIEDENGKIYPPAAFMDIAKKYHLYIPISTLMMEQVFALFNERKEVVSINISAHDINFFDMRSTILRNLKNLKDPSNFIFEILEDEKFRNMNMMCDFIKEVRQYGVKIAIDDFGTGYLNFMEILKIEPDYIKIDGSIVREVIDNPISKKVLESIVLLGKQLEVEIVAEFVENYMIQDVIMKMSVQYSQGFYFSKPQPFSFLNLV